MATQPLWLNFTNPTILGLEAPGSKKTINWPVNYVVVPELTTEVSNDKWIYLLVNGMGFPWLPKARTFFPVAHPVRNLACIQGPATRTLTRRTDTSSWTRFRHPVTVQCTVLARYHQDQDRQPTTPRRCTTPCRRTPAHCLQG